MSKQIKKSVFPDDINISDPSFYKYHDVEVGTYLNNKGERMGYATINKKDNKRTSEAKTNQIDKAQKSEVEFNASTGVIRYDEIIYSFHRGERGEKPRLKLFRKLWSSRRVIENGINKNYGEPLTLETLIVQLDMIVCGSNFDEKALREKAKPKLKELIKGINRALRRKKFPAKIETKGAVQLVITEK